jgi:hypothetical protein
MKGGKRTAKGRIINIDDLIASAPHTTAVGNMRINAQGDQLGKGGEVTASREQRTRAYYKNHPQASNKKVSLKGHMKEAFADEPDMMAPKTSQTAKENVRTSVEDDMASDISSFTDTENPSDVVAKAMAEAEQEPEAPEPEEFEDVEMPPEDMEPEPDGFEEVQLPNGDIEMRPYWNDNKDEDTGSKLA